VSGEAAGSRSAAGILLVDDSKDNLTALAAVLEPLGERVVTARSGRDALARLLEDRFAVILLDVHMPDMDGFECRTWTGSRRPA
jgi:CheY-like chemotaxis protein